jgi:hypothetical protein
MTDDYDDTRDALRDALLTGVPPLDLLQPRTDNNLHDRIERAHAEVAKLAEHGRDHWRMRIPADPTRDSDLILTAGLDVAGAALARAEKAEATLARVEALAERWENALAPDQQYARALRAALNPPEETSDDA